MADEEALVKNDALRIDYIRTGARDTVVRVVGGDVFIKDAVCSDNGTIYV